MFVFSDTPVRFVGLLLLFLLCTLWSIYELTRPQNSRRRISNVLHLLMAVVMLLMVSPATWTRLVAVAPTPALVGLFALSTAWFVWLATDRLRRSDRSGGLHFGGHAAMFAAMTWHLAAMAVMHAAMSPGTAMDRGSGPHAGGMSKGEWMTAQGMPGGVMWAFALVGLPLMAYLLISSLRSLWQVVQPRTAIAASGCGCGPDCACGPECSCRLNHKGAMVREPELVSQGSTAPVRLPVVAPAFSSHSCHEVRPVGTAKYRLQVLSAFAMNFGMFWMSTGLMVPILPFFRLLAF